MKFENKTIKYFYKDNENLFTYVSFILIFCVLDKF